MASISMKQRKSMPYAAALMATAVLLLSQAVAPAEACPGGRCPTPTPTTPAPAVKCPLNALKLGVCAEVLDGLVHLKVGQPPKEPCCSLISGLVDLEAAACVCLAIKANVLGIILDVDVDISLLVNYCGRGVPAGFKCPM